MPDESSASSGEISANLSANSAQSLTQTCNSSITSVSQSSNPSQNINQTSNFAGIISKHSVNPFSDIKQANMISATASNQLNEPPISDNSSTVLNRPCNCRKIAVNTSATSSAEPNQASNYAAFCTNKTKQASDCTVISANSSNQPVSESTSDTIGDNLSTQPSPSSPSHIISALSTTEPNYDLNHESVLLNDELFAEVRPRFSLSQAFAEEDDEGFNHEFAEQSVTLEGNCDASSKLRCAHDVRFSSCRVISGHNRGASLDLSLINQASNSSSFRSSFDDEDFRNTRCNGYGDVKLLHCHRRSSGSASSGLGFLSKIKWSKLFGHGATGVKKKIKASKVWIDESSETSGLSRQVSDSSLAVQLVRDAKTETSQRPLSICCAKPVAHHSAKVSSMASCAKQMEKQGTLSPSTTRSREAKQSAKTSFIMAISDNRDAINGAKTPLKSKSETREVKHASKSPLMLSSSKHGFKQSPKSPLLASFAKHGIKKQSNGAESIVNSDQESANTALIGSKRLMASDNAVHLVRAGSEAMSKKHQMQGNQRWQKKMNLFSQIRTKKTKRGLVIKLRAGRNKKIGHSQSSAGSGCDCTMQEFHSAVQSAIAHCKLSMAS